MNIVLSFPVSYEKAGNMRKCGHISEKAERVSTRKSRKISKLDNNILL